MKSPVEKVAVPAVHQDKGINIFRICKVTAGLAADENFLAQLPGFFKEDDAGTHFGGLPCGHHASGAAADDYYISFAMHTIIKVNGGLPFLNPLLVIAKKIRGFKDSKLRKRYHETRGMVKVIPVYYYILWRLC